MIKNLIIISKHLIQKLHDIEVIYFNKQANYVRTKRDTSRDVLNGSVSVSLLLKFQGSYLQYRYLRFIVIYLRGYRMEICSC